MRRDRNGIARSPLSRTVDSKRLRPPAIADAVASVVRRGGVVIFPTDTVYGIGCDPVRPEAVARIFALKDRPLTKALTLHLATIEEMLEYAADNALARALAAAFLPGPLTVIVRRPPFVGAFVTAGRDTLGLRVPRHALCQAILERSGPLATTSANFSGAPAFVGNGFVTELPAADLRVDDGPTPLGVESTVIDVSGERAYLVRAGAIETAMLERIVGRVVRPDAGVGEG